MARVSRNSSIERRYYLGLLWLILEHPIPQDPIDRSQNYIAQSNRTNGPAGQGRVNEGDAYSDIILKRFWSSPAGWRLTSGQQSVRTKSNYIARPEHVPSKFVGL